MGSIFTVAFVDTLFAFTNQKDSKLDFYEQMNMLDIKVQEEILETLQKKDPVQVDEYLKNSGVQKLKITCNNDRLDVERFNCHDLLTGNFFKRKRDAIKRWGRLGKHV